MGREGENKYEIKKFFFSFPIGIIYFHPWKFAILTNNKISYDLPDTVLEPKFIHQNSKFVLPPLLAKKHSFLMKRRS